MKTYKLLRIKKGILYPLYVDYSTPLPVGEWLTAKVGEKADDKHVKSRLGKLSLRPGYHSTKVPFADWIGKRGADGKLYKAPDTVWCECSVCGDQITDIGSNGMREVPDGWYYFKTNRAQPEPWIVSKHLRIDRILTDEEVDKICREYGWEPQPLWSEYIKSAATA